MDTITYTGDFLKKGNKALKLDAYDPNPDLTEAVNLAILLEQPLLLMGEPGSGKTRLAEAVAAELHEEKWKEHYFRWDVKSTSKAKEGIYYYDALKRMYDATSKNEDAKMISKYITYGKFAEALTKPPNGDIPNILLIDEIDKADIDFPNDLLLEIEKGEFTIPELNEKVERKNPLIIFITSNREKELPPAFLRRCLYYYISFPKLDDLIKIVSGKFDQKSDDLFVKKSVTLFLDIRKKIEDQFADNEKKPATSELLEWFEVINHYRNLDKNNSLNKDQKLLLDTIENYDSANFATLKIPFQQVLLKTWESNQLFPIR